MHGIDAKTGLRLDGIEHLRQSITDILMTPIGSRVMRRDYGSNIFEYIDAPFDRVTLALIYAECVKALEEWEPRFELKKIEAQMIELGKYALDIEGIYLPEQEEVRLETIVI